MDKDSLAKYGSMTVDDFEAAAASRNLQTPPDGDKSDSDDQKNSSSSKVTAI